MKKYLVIGSIIIVVIIIALLYIRKREKFGTALGTLAPYNVQLAECLRLCEKDDVSSRFGMRYNPICIRRCYRNFDTQLLLNEQSITTIPPTPRQGCIGEVVDKCIQKCNHTCGDMLSTYCKCNKGKYNDCVNLCVDTLKNNCNSVEWTWRY